MILECAGARQQNKNKPTRKKIHSGQEFGALPSACAPRVP